MKPIHRSTCKALIYGRSEEDFQEVKVQYDFLIDAPWYEEPDYTVIEATIITPLLIAPYDLNSAIEAAIDLDLMAKGNVKMHCRIQTRQAVRFRIAHEVTEMMFV